MPIFLYDVDSRDQKRNKAIEREDHAHELTCDRGLLYFWHEAGIQRDQTDLLSLIHLTAAAVWSNPFTSTNAAMLDIC